MNSNPALGAFGGIVVSCLASPAFAFDCMYPPGYPKGAAQWEQEGRIIEEYLLTSSGQKYSCGSNVNTVKSQRRIGDREHYKRTCGPLEIVTENVYRECTLSERAGTSGGYGRLGEFKGAIIQYLCAKSGSISDSKLRLRDRSGSEFELAKYGDVDGRIDIKTSCTSQKKTNLTSREFDVGNTSAFIKLVKVEEYGVRLITQPSF